MYILGISNGYTATATLMKDGRVVASASEERFNGIKNYNGFPKHAIVWCLKFAGITGQNLDLVTTPYRYRPPIHAPLEQTEKFLSLSLLVEASKLFNILRTMFRELRFRFPILRPFGMVAYRVFAYVIGKYYTYKHRQFIANFLGIDVRKVVAYDHHLSHAAASYYASPFNRQKALVFTLDAEGDNYCASVSIFDREKIRVLARTPREYSPGYIYGSVTKFLGMKPHEHEYKVMGLAPYAKAEDVDRIYQRIKDCLLLDPLNPLKFWMPVNAQDFSKYLKENLFEVRFDHVAGAFQKLLEERIVEWVQSGIKATGIDTVIVGGGVFMNVKANQRVAAIKAIRKFFVLPSCADESAPLGCCYLGYRDLCLKTGQQFLVEPIGDIYWGPDVSREDLKEIVARIKNSKHLRLKHLKNPSQEIAKFLVQGEVVARMAGRMEFGARALGNRSLLANPSQVKIVREINLRMKNRDFWMPFAPTILWERMGEYIKNPRNIPSPYMMLTFDTTPLGQEKLIAAIHPYDYTLRPQLLTKEMNPSYYAIINAFEKMTGIGAVLNTSFNLHGYPIVLGPKEALSAFQNSGLKYLVIEDYLISKA